MQLGLVAALCAACGGDWGEGKTKGQVMGKSLTVRSALFAAGSVPLAEQPNQLLPLLVVALSSDADACPRLKAGKRRAETDAAYFLLLADDRATNPNAPTPMAPRVGRFVVHATDDLGNSAEATYSRRGKACAQEIEDVNGDALAGEINLSTLDGKTAGGDFTLKVGQQGDDLSGSFSAVPCPALIDQAAGKLQPTCED